MAFYVDFEFDGHGGNVLSAGIVSDVDDGMHISVSDAKVTDLWVQRNVMPLMQSHAAPRSHHVRTNEIGYLIREYIGAHDPTFFADSPVDIWRLCQVLTTDADGAWASCDYSAMGFFVRNVDCYPTDLPGAVQHNAWWDAMALRHKLTR